MKKKVIRLTESDLEKLVKKIITEVGGYDDPTIMGTHASKSMENLTGVYDELSNILQGLANAIMDDFSVSELSDFLNDVVNEIEILVDTTQKTIKDFTEDDMIDAAKRFIKELKSFQRKIIVLMNFSDSMGNELEFKERLKNMVQGLIPMVKEYGKKLRITNDTFRDRFSSGMGFN
jgi:hypothetical protein